MKKKSQRTIGILTAGGDCPGLNAVIRGVAKAAMHHGLTVLGIHDGFRGLVENRATLIDNAMVSGILTHGGTFLGSSRDRPHKMNRDGKVVDMTAVAARNYRRLRLDCLVCLGGNGTQKTALRLSERGGMNVMTLPKTIDNDVAETRIIAQHASGGIEGIHLVQEAVASRLARQLQQLTGVEARVTSLGHVQRGGVPTPFDRLLCTRLGTKAGELLAEGRHNIMVGVRGTQCVPVPLQNVAGIKRTVPPQHPWVTTARLVETCLGD